MKFFAIFFSLYMTVLALMPCQDKEDIAREFTAHYTIQKGHSGTDKCGQETCSPFCICACCSTVRALQQHAITQHLEKPVFKVYAALLTPALQQVSISIWQPPQLS
ncbi:MAG: hypothetical protein EOP45_00835 [Sphingobacteriaceae bacterium]|nr:MAG: hypothetical protein EOP45_00835 [Sphingobacteriaceae bacterium]